MSKTIKQPNLSISLGIIMFPNLMSLKLKYIAVENFVAPSQLEDSLVGTVATFYFAFYQTCMQGFFSRNL